MYRSFVNRFPLRLKQQSFAASTRPHERLDNIRSTWVRACCCCCCCCRLHRTIHTALLLTSGTAIAYCCKQYRYKIIHNQLKLIVELTMYSNNIVVLCNRLTVGLIPDDNGSSNASLSRDSIAAVQPSSATIHSRIDPPPFEAAVFMTLKTS